MQKVYHRIDGIAGNVINITADGVKYKELAEVTSRASTSLAQVIRLDGDEDHVLGNGVKLRESGYLQDLRYLLWAACLRQHVGHIQHVVVRRTYGTAVVLWLQFNCYRHRIFLLEK